MKAMDLLRAPRLQSGFIQVWRRNFLHYKKTWVVSLLWTILEPLMYLGGIGYGLGAYVNNMSGQTYVEFFFPGLLCFTAMMVSFFEACYGNFTKLTWQKTYSTIMMTRISPEEIVFGELLWVATKGFFGVCGVTLVAFVLGLVETWMILPTLLVLFLVCWLFSALGMIVTSLVRNYDAFVYFTSGFIVPMSLLSGVYYPLEQLPPGLQQATWLLPLTHAVESVRGLLTTTDPIRLGLHLFVLFAVSWVAMNLSIFRIREKLLK